MSDFNKIKFVILDCPYDTWDDPRTRELFTKMVGLKLRGFRHEHFYGVMPVDASDFVGLHQIICEEREGELNPVLASRVISLDRCRVHNLVFPALSLVRLAQAPEHEEVVQSIVDRCERNGIGLSYDSSWTIDPEIRKDRARTARLRDMFTAIYVLSHQEYNLPEIIGGGTLRFKADQYFSYWGYEWISRSGRRLDPISVAHLGGEQVAVMHLQRFSPEALAIADQWKLLWKRRLIIRHPEEFLEAINGKKKRAA